MLPANRINAAQLHGNKITGREAGPHRMVNLAENQLESKQWTLQVTHLCVSVSLADPSPPPPPSAIP